MSPECPAWQKGELMFPYLWLIRLLWNVWMNPQELETPKSLLKTHPVLNPGRSKQKIVSNVGGNTTSSFKKMHSGKCELISNLLLLSELQLPIHAPWKITDCNPLCTATSGLSCISTLCDSLSVILLKCIQYRTARE